jgi:acyl carrier protein
MSAMEKLKECFVETFGLTATDDPTILAYQGIPAWDSVGHMQLIAAIETTFDIMMDTPDVLAMSDFQRAVDIVRKYGVDV